MTMITSSSVNDAICPRPTQRDPLFKEMQKEYFQRFCLFLFLFWSTMIMKKKNDENLKSILDEHEL